MMLAKIFERKKGKQLNVRAGQRKGTNRIDCAY